MKLPMFVSIPEAAFNEIDPVFRVIAHDHARKYGALQLPQTSYQLTVSWRSDLIDPVIVTDQKAQVVWLGVDQRVACVSLRGSTMLSMGLTSSIFQIKLLEEFTLILCETQVIAVNRDFTIRKICDLVNISDDVNFVNNKLVVRFVGGEMQAFSI